MELEAVVVVTMKTDQVWMFELPAMDVDTICHLEVSQEGAVITLSDVIFGDVWMCSGTKMFS